MAKIESHNTLEKILENGIIAISRGNYGDTLLRAVDAAARGGIKAVEITFEQNLAPEIAGEALDKLVRRFGTVLAVGAGTVLIPWGVISFLRGNTVLGVGLLVLYALCSVSRAFLEPRFLGKQIGLNPLVTLAALYAGYRLFGILGMILLPFAVILLKQLYELIESA